MEELGGTEASVGPEAAVWSVEGRAAAMTAALQEDLRRELGEKEVLEAVSPRRPPRGRAFRGGVPALTS